MSPAIYQRFRPVGAFKALVHRRQSRDLQAELGAAIEERNDLRRSRDWWRDYAIEAAGHSLEQTEALRAALIGMLWIAVGAGPACGCLDDDPEPSTVCMAWRALGFEGHFDAYKAADLLPLVRP